MKYLKSLRVLLPSKRAVQSFFIMFFVVMTFSCISHFTLTGIMVTFDLEPVPSFKDSVLIIQFLFLWLYAEVVHEEVLREKKEAGRTESEEV